MPDTREPTSPEAGPWSGLGPPEQVQILRDPDLGMAAVVVIHDSRFGPAFGGIRRHRYPDLAAAVADAERLAAAMTAKCAVHGIPGGGGKAVLLAEPPADAMGGGSPGELARAGAYRRLGAWVDAMGGRFYTGPDVGTGAGDLAEVAAATRFVTAPGPSGPGDLAIPTALGVFAGICATAAHLGGDGEDLTGLHVVVQGLGAVGGRLVLHLLEAGARVTACDVDPEVAAELQQHLPENVPFQSAPVAEITAVPCDIFAPCALGGVLDGTQGEQLPARGVCGAANNQAHDPAALAALHRRGVWVAPDFVVNSGALVHGALFHLAGQAPPPERIREIGPLLGELFQVAAREDLTPAEAALRRVRERLGTAPRGPYLPPR